MINISKKPKAYFIEEININSKYLIKSYINDYGENGEKLFTEAEELTRNKYWQGREIPEKGIRLFCRDCHYYKICKGIKWNRNCKYQKEFLRIIEKYGGEKNE